MNEETLRFAWASILIAGALALSFAAGGFSGNVISSVSGEYREYSVSELMEKLPENRRVEVRGTVSDVLGDYVSKKGYRYQRFYISDGKQEVMVFCSKYKGSADVKKGDEVRVSGKFQKYYGKYEIYAECRNVAVG